MDSASKLRAELEDALIGAENDLLIADYAEDTAKMLREKESARRRIKAIKARLAEIEEDE